MREDRRASGQARKSRPGSEDARRDRPDLAPLYAIFNRRRKSFYLQRPDGSPMTFASLDGATSVCAALNREDPNDADPEYRVEEVRE